jgi:hypothetical protein
VDLADIDQSEPLRTHCTSTLRLAVMFITSILYATLAIAIAVWMFNCEEVLLRT